MKENKSMLHDGELQALKNALNSLNLNGYSIHQNFPKKFKYFLTDDKGNSLTGEWDYIRINHFIMGYGKALKSAKEENDRLREALKLMLDKCHAILFKTTDRPISPTEYKNFIGAVGITIETALK